MTEPKPLPPLDQAVEAYVDARVPTSAQIEGALASVHAKIAAGQGGPSLVEEPPRGSGASLLGRRLWLVGGGTAIVLAALFLLSRGEQPSSAPEPELVAELEQPPLHGEASAPLAPNSSAEPQIASAGEPPMEAEPLPSSSVTKGDTAPPPAPVRAKPAAKRPSKVKRAPASTSDASSLLAELELMRDARQALRRANYGQALQLLERHERQFPHSQFEDERSQSMKVARCKLDPERCD